ncbi:hypothetical protein Acr_03g0017690 [Actinidia rufa]|uniref:Ankyrin repeat family protein n=1 Tax=Actinidia rufa TaxID=165716 RepID=A0A7J0EEW1_9ERIC|nr:hypothetical protein Acr_03g0017690 [Actinidia rufa]
MDPSLYKAAMEGNIGVLMQNRDRFEEQVTPTNNTVLHVTAQFNDNADNVRGILETQSSLLLRVNSRGETALHIAARNGHSSTVEALIGFAKTQSRDPESGLEIIEQMVRTTCENKDTALHEAVRNNHLGVVELLVEEDKKFSHVANNSGETPLYLAAERDYHEIVFLILTTCTSPAFNGPNGRTALHAAVFSGCIVLSQVFTLPFTVKMKHRGILPPLSAYVAKLWVLSGLNPSIHVCSPVQVAQAIANVKYRGPPPRDSWIAEQIRIMNENNALLIQHLATNNPLPLAATLAPKEVNRSHHSHRSGDQRNPILFELRSSSGTHDMDNEDTKRRRRLPHRGNRAPECRDRSTTQKIQNLDAWINAINNGPSALVTVDALIRQTEPPFTERVIRTRVSSRFKLPTQIGVYERKTNPMDNLDSYKNLMTLQGYSDEVVCKAFSATLKGPTRSWFKKLCPRTVDSFGDLSKLFVANFMRCRIRQKNASTYS